MLDHIFFLVLLCVGSAVGTSLDSILKRVQKEFMFDEGCDGMICDNFVCIPLSVICDNQANCQDGADELFCPCTQGHFQCWNGLQCIPGHLLCDGVEDCDDASDESFDICEVEEGSGFGCSDEMFMCDDHSCVEEAQDCTRRIPASQDADRDAETAGTTTASPEEDLSFEETVVVDTSPKLEMNPCLSLIISLVIYYHHKFGFSY